MQANRCSIIWFTSDLRLTDNAVVTEAIQHSDEVIAVYCIDDRHFGQSAFGFRKTGDFRSLFILQSLQDLDLALRAKGSGLILRKGRPEDILPALAEEFCVKKIYTKKQVGSEELSVQNAVRQRCLHLRCELEVIPSSSLYLAADLPFTVKNIPEMFTDFRKKAEREAIVRPSLPEPKNIPGEIPPPADWTLWPQTDQKKDSRTAFPFEGGAEAAKKRLQYYLFESHKIASYKETRNGLLGVDYSSKLSPWLAHGCISPREIYHKVKAYEEQHIANESTYWLIFELLWRDYFRFLMKKHPLAYFQRDGLQKNGTYPMQHSEEKLKSWIEGKTGVDFIDANMLELKHTGFMSNRGRQNVASYLCHDLQCDWRYGAAYFEEMLIDYDVSSNWGNWAYIAGVGNDPRTDRYFNIERQSQQYDKTGEYRALWLGKVTSKN